MKDKAYNQLMSLLCIAIGTAFVTCCLFFYFFDSYVMMKDSCVRFMMVIALVLIGVVVILLLVAAYCAIFSGDALCHATDFLHDDTNVILVRKETKDKIILFRCKDLQDAVKKITSKDEIHICGKKAKLNKQTLQCLKSKVDSLEEVTICFGNCNCSDTTCYEIEAKTTNSTNEER